MEWKILKSIDLIGAALYPDKKYSMPDTLLSKKTWTDLEIFQHSKQIMEYYDTFRDECELLYLKYQEYKNNDDKFDEAKKNKYKKVNIACYHNVYNQCNDLIIRGHYEQSFKYEALQASLYMQIRRLRVIMLYIESTMNLKIYQERLGPKLVSKLKQGIWDQYGSGDKAIKKSFEVYVKKLSDELLSAQIKLCDAFRDLLGSSCNNDSMKSYARFKIKHKYV